MAAPRTYLAIVQDPRGYPGPGAPLDPAPPDGPVAPNLITCIRLDDHERAVDEAMAMVTNDRVTYQMALRVVRELIDDGPGTAAQLAERMTEKNEEGATFAVEHVEAAVGVLDQWSLVVLPGPGPDDEDDGPVELWS